MTVNYRVATDWDPEWLIREKKEGDVSVYEVWNETEKKWYESPSLIGYFIGFEPSHPITEEKAKEIMAES